MRPAKTIQHRKTLLRKSVNAAMIQIGSVSGLGNTPYKITIIVSQCCRLRKRWIVKIWRQESLKNPHPQLETIDCLKNSF
jgi:hypothetical protein